MARMCATDIKASIFSDKPLNMYRIPVSWNRECMTRESNADIPQLALLFSSRPFSVHPFSTFLLHTQHTNSLPIHIKADYISHFCCIEVWQQFVQLVTTILLSWQTDYLFCTTAATQPHQISTNSVQTKCEALFNLRFSLADRSAVLRHSLSTSYIKASMTALPRNRSQPLFQEKHMKCRTRYKHFHSEAA